MGVYTMLIQSKLLVAADEVNEELKTCRTDE